jgi:undecaprenyl-diphosphatase
LLAVSLAAFVGIALGTASRGPLIALDQHVAQRLMASGPGGWSAAMLVLARVHGVAGIAVVGALWAAWLWRRGETMQLARLGLFVGGGLALNSALKQVFQRQRPAWGDGAQAPLDLLSSYSFPSGHVSGSVVFYGFVLMAVFARTANRCWRVAAVAAACALVTLIAYNRLYLGAHFVSDVLAAAAEGLAWLAFCALLQQHLLRRSST